jgi:hypothetical protein
MNDIEALVSLTAGAVRSWCRWQDAPPMPRYEERVATDNAVDNNLAWQAVNGHARVIRLAPLHDEDNDYND